MLQLPEKWPEFEALGFEPKPVYAFKPAALSAGQLLYAAGGKIVVEADLPDARLLLSFNRVGTLHYGKKVWYTEPYIYSSLFPHEIFFEGAVQQFEWQNEPVQLTRPHAIRGCAVFNSARFAKMLYLQSTGPAKERFVVKQWQP